ncbi:MAG: N-acetylmuramoyl-L-alanine amidase [Eubacterium sp.]|nr:N-acetylmuramoyl-L-alanine amidase [Clostridiales bacterium]MDY3774693.1 N-acetylmuramoyl-L-alanine amidase [Eubacterium sp.]
MPIKIFVDQGHNPYGINAGAEAFGVREQDITYLVGAYLTDILNADPRFDAMASRQSPDEILGYDTNSSLRERVDMANSWGADYFISIHVNANVNPDIQGTECYVYSENSPSYYLAGDIIQEIVRRIGTKNNGIYVRPSLYVLRRTQMPAVLVELAYLTNYEDFVLLTTMQYQFAYAIYVGILNYLGLPQ